MTTSADTKHRFTRASLTALSPPSTGRLTFRDEQARGLILEIQSTGTKTFRIYRKLNGKPTKITLGRFNSTLPETRDFQAGTDPLLAIGHAAELNVRMARKLAEAVNASLDRGINPAAQARTTRTLISEELTLRQAFGAYFNEHLVPHGKRTAVDLCNDFARYLGAVPSGQKKLHGQEKVKSAGSVNWEARKLSSISQADVRTMMNSLRENVGPRTANKVLVLLRSIYNKMEAWQRYSGTNPCAGIEKYKEISRDRFVTGDELPRFMAALEKVEHQGFKDFILLSLYTGMRRANVLGMRWTDIDLDAGFITVPSERSKNGVAQRIPIVSATRAILTRRNDEKAANSNYVFPAAGTDGHMAPPNKRWKSLLVDCGISDLRLHDLRRSLGSWAAMGGASLPIIGKMLGHTSNESTAVYAQLQLDPVTLAMETATMTMVEKGKPKTVLQPLPPTVSHLLPQVQNGSTP